MAPPLRHASLTLLVLLPGALGLVPVAPRVRPGLQRNFALSSPNEVDLDLPLEEAAAVTPSSDRKGPPPKLALPGDSLETQWWQTALLGATWATTSLLAVHVVQSIASPTDALVLLATLAYSVAFADLFSGFFHWVVDNYGGLETPVFGGVIAAFQGHHDTPWTITYRAFPNNVYKICYAALPGVALTLLATQFLCLSPVLAVFFATYFNGQILAQEFHKYSHIQGPVPPLVARLQSAGVMLSKKEHLLHHKEPYMNRYCILNGMNNDILDRSGVWRRCEKLVYDLSGQEPNTWKLNAELRARALRGEFEPPARGAAPSVTPGVEK